MSKAEDKYFESSILPPYKSTAMWMYWLIHKKSMAEKLKTDWAKKLYSISKETDEMPCDLWLTQSLISYSRFSDTWKNKIDQPAALGKNYEKIADDAVKFSSDDTLAEFLAVLLVYGGEYCVYNLSFRFYLPLAKLRFNISGGRIPRDFEIIQKKCFELEQVGSGAPWFKEFYNNKVDQTMLPRIEAFEPIPEKFRQIRNVVS